MNAKLIMAMCLAAAAAAYGQGKENFMQQQAYAEMQRVSGQVDVLQGNLGDLQQRVGKLEGGGDSRGLRREIDSLRAEVAQLRRDMQNLRAEIVKDLSGRISKMQTSAPAPKQTTKQVVIGPHQEYVVQSGDTLSLVAQAFNISVAKIKEMNNLKSDSLRVGQKLMLPK